MKLWPFARAPKAHPESSKSADLELIGRIDAGGYLVGGTSASTAMMVTAVLACARVIAEGVAQIPLKTYREMANGVDLPLQGMPSLQRLLRHYNGRPNDWQTSFEFREMMTTHAVLTGNAYAYVTRYGGEVRELIPILPQNVYVEHMTNYAVRYHVADGKEISGYVPARNILHIKGPPSMADNVLGANIVRLASEAIGLARAMEVGHSAIYRNGGRPSGILTTEQALGAEAIKRLSEQWTGTLAGAEKKGKTPVLDSGVQYKAIESNATDMQLVENRRLQIEEICRAFRVFPLMVGVNDKSSTFASVEQFLIAHVLHTLMPWLERWEQALDKAISPSEDVYFRHDVDDLMRGTARDRAEYNARALGSGGSPGWMTVNEIRARDALNPIEGGDVLYRPLNSATDGDGGEDETN